MTREEAPALRVPTSEGEAARRALLDAGLLRTDLAIRRQGAHLLLPLTAPGGGEAAGLSHPEVAAAFDAVAQEPASYRDLLDLPSALMDVLPTSFDLLGAVIIVKLDDALQPHRAAVGEALLAAVKPARTVALDRGVKGDFRVRDLEVIAGEPGTETEHVEFGVRLRVDPAAAYFSPRLATERHRVAREVAPGEVVVDLFAGVGPFAVMMAKLARPRRVVAVDVNPEAVRLMRENVALNGVEAVVEPVLGDAREVALGLESVADRVVMNLPHSAGEFLDAALAVAKPGAVLHYHAILDPEDLHDHLGDLSRRAAALGWRLAPVAHREVRAYSPQEAHVAVDLQVERVEP